MKLYSPPANHVLSKIIFTSRISNRPIQHQLVAYGYKNKQFHQHNALFTLPALQISQNQYVFGTHSIMRVLAPKGHELSVFEQASVNQWLELIERQLQPAVGVIILSNNQLADVKQQQSNRAKDIVIKVAKLLDDRLKVNTFLVGNSLTIADISAYFSWNQVSSSLQKQGKHFTNLHRWSNHISSIPLK